MLFDLIYLFFLHIIGWRLSVSINDMLLCYVIPILPYCLISKGRSEFVGDIHIAGPTRSAPN